jgi:hypothetical protein
MPCFLWAALIKLYPFLRRLSDSAGQLGHRSAAGGQVTLLVFRHECELNVFLPIAGIFASDGTVNKQRVTLRIVAPDFAGELVQHGGVADPIRHRMAEPGAALRAVVVDPRRPHFLGQLRLPISYALETSSSECHG